ncbi:TLDc domain-containing protein, partial [Cantharellus anzutake]|uniref:TLDc domain-containing protein n=1 Tax=Cantharellus anzutake TaxID=1750568 RepID=UPI001903FF11
NQIRRHIPPLYRLGQEWTLLYSLDQHGISLGTLYSRTSKFTTEGGCLLCVKDDNDTIFGVWIGDGIRRSIGESYYGSGESFLWKQQADTDFSDGRPTKARVFKWTGKNEYVALCLPDSMSFGGGDGKYGLFLDSNLLDGSSAPCPTFDNEILCSDLQDGKGMARFECVGLEVWGIPR